MTIGETKTHSHIPNTAETITYRILAVFPADKWSDNIHMVDNFLLNSVEVLQGDLHFFAVYVLDFGLAMSSAYRPPTPGFSLTYLSCYVE
jgi:hypothetical protein